MLIFKIIENIILDGHKIFIVNNGSKKQIIREFEKGQKNITLAEKYNVHPSTVSRIIKHKEDILKSCTKVSEVGGNVKKRKKCVKESVLDESHYIWF